MKSNFFVFSCRWDLKTPTYCGKSKKSVLLWHLNFHGVHITIPRIFYPLELTNTSTIPYRYLKIILRPHVPVLRFNIQSSITLLQVVIVLFYFHIARSFGLVLRKTGGVHNECYLFGETPRDHYLM